MEQYELESTLRRFTSEFSDVMQTFLRDFRNISTDMASSMEGLSRELRTHAEANEHLRNAIKEANGKMDDLASKTFKFEKLLGASLPKLQEAIVQRVQQAAGQTESPAPSKPQAPKHKDGDWVRRELKSNLSPQEARKLEVGKTTDTKLFPDGTRRTYGRNNEGQVAAIFENGEWVKMVNLEDSKKSIIKGHRANINEKLAEIAKTTGGVRTRAGRKAIRDAVTEYRKVHPKKTQSR